LNRLQFPFDDVEKITQSGDLKRDIFRSNNNLSSMDNSVEGGTVQGEAIATTVSEENNKKHYK
jgi:hypothetical protein